MQRSIQFGKISSTSWTHVAGLGCCVIACLIFFVAFYRPIRNARLDEQHRIQQLTKLISDSRAAKVQSGLLERELELLTNHVASVRERIPDASNEAEMLRQLTTIAGESEFFVSDYRRGQFQTEGIHARFEIGITGYGNYTSICKFLHSIHQLPRVNRIERLEISTANENEKYPVNLTISVFYGGSVANS